MQEKLPVLTEIPAFRSRSFFRLGEILQISRNIKVTLLNSSLLPNKDIILMLCVKGNVASLLEPSRKHTMF